MRVAFATIWCYDALMTLQPSEETIQAWIQLHKSQRMLLERVELALKKNGLPPLDWYDVLLELSRDTDSGLRQYEIGQRMLLSKHNLSRLIDRLEKNRLVRRDACAEDGRGNRIRIAEEGKALLGKAWPVYRKALQDNFGEKLTPAEMIELARLLGKVSKRS